MKILIISPGKKHDLLVADAILEFEMRLKKHLPIEWAFPAAGEKQDEAKVILKLLKEDDFAVLLDERGADIDTIGVSKLLSKAMLSGVKRLVFIIGGAFGVSSEVAARANLTIKLSSLVFPHMLVRLILVEQLYRAHSVLSGGKYHHA